MSNRNIVNMITSIISSIIVLIFMPLEIIKQVYNYSVFGVIFVSIIFPIMLVYFVIRSIYHGISNDTGKNVLYRIGKVFFDIFIGLITIYFILFTSGVIKWVLFGLVCIFTIICIFLDIFNIFDIFKYVLYGLDAILLIIIILCNYSFNILVFMSLISIILFYIGNVFGKIIDNKLLLSTDILSLLLFNLFLLLI